MKSIKKTVKNVTAKIKKAIKMPKRKNMMKKDCC